MARSGSTPARTQAPQALTLITLLITLALSAGCGTIEYHAYTGPQSDWPTADYDNRIHRTGMPIYRGLPNKPYQILGTIALEDANDDGQLADCVKQHNGDAGFIVVGEKEFRGFYNFGDYAKAKYINHGTGVIITFRPPAIRRDEQNKYVIWHDYEGQQTTWPTQASAFVTKAGAFPIYERGQLPSRPYRVCGSIEGVSMATTGELSTEEVIAEAVAVARRHACDALIQTAFKPKDNGNQPTIFYHEWWAIQFLLSADPLQTTTSPHSTPQVSNP